MSLVEALLGQLRQWMDALIDHKQPLTFYMSNSISTIARLVISLCTESRPLRAVHLSRHKWPGGLVNKELGRLSESYLIIFHGLGEVQRLLSSLCAPLSVQAAFTDHIQESLEVRDTHRLSGEQRALGVGLLSFTRKPGPDSGPRQDQHGFAFLNPKP